MQEVTGSIPVVSTKNTSSQGSVFFLPSDEYNFDERFDHERNRCGKSAQIIFKKTKRLVFFSLASHQYWWYDNARLFLLISVYGLTKVFMETYLICLAVALVGSLLLSRLTKLLHLPAVTAYLIAGLLLGPFCLGALGMSGVGFNSLEQVKSEAKRS